MCASLSLLRTNPCYDSNKRAVVSSSRACSFHLIFCSAAVYLLPLTHSIVGKRLVFALPAIFSRSPFSKCTLLVWRRSDPCPFGDCLHSAHAPAFTNPSIRRLLNLGAAAPAYRPCVLLPFRLRVPATPISNSRIAEPLKRPFAATVAIQHLVYLRRTPSHTPPP